MDSLKNREPIPFEAELNHVMNYLYLEQQRFGDKLQVIYQIKTEGFLIPPLTLQPLVENAVQHGVLHRKTSSTGKTAAPWSSAQRKPMQGPW